MDTEIEQKTDRLTANCPVKIVDAGNGEWVVVIKQNSHSVRLRPVRSQDLVLRIEPNREN